MRRPTLRRTAPPHSRPSFSPKLYSPATVQRALTPAARRGRDRGAHARGGARTLARARAPSPRCRPHSTLQPCKRAPHPPRSPPLSQTRRPTRWCASRFALPTRGRRRRIRRTGRRPPSTRTLRPRPTRASRDSGAASRRVSRVREEKTTAGRACCGRDVALSGARARARADVCRVCVQASMSGAEAGM